MQNKPNFRNDKMNTNLDMTSIYMILSRWLRPKNKPNSKPIQTQLNPKQTQFNPIQTQNKPKQTQSPPSLSTRKPMIKPLSLSTFPFTRLKN